MSLEQFIEQFSKALADGSFLSLMIAALAGIISTGVCPCTLPVGLGIAGLVSSNTVQKSNRGYMIAFAFFCGIVVCLTVLGALAGQLGIFLTETFGRYWALSMALISGVAAVTAFYGPRLKVAKLAALRKPGIINSFTYGLIFSLGTSAAPLLLLLSVAAAKANPVFGFLLALFFGAGRGLPFLIVSVFAGVVAKFAQFTWLRRSIQIVSGTALLFVCYYYIKVYINLQ
ncbi:cytochrome c biogenesis CcdA family protein [Chitinophaga japonensis]|uniref:Cytochrome c-type biogenesis protein n=1 Tax=Chitinophaga japonensis TaxID=104662 RepID=A0A562SPH4_CHIJA|nr:cytochrome c biogenesis protein CcdA [Chitinophaga japonensis]TWI82586.1 cytochrome c-type biogenesis protein [Chitinophaga japonensis]